MFNCAECKANKRLKKINGCVKPVSKRVCKRNHGIDGVWQTDECYVCGGEDEKCRFCKGSNALPVYRCPRALAKEAQTLLPYFRDWRISNHMAWPSGGARLQQPVKLTQAFDMLDNLFVKYESERQQDGS